MAKFWPKRSRYHGNAGHQANGNCPKTPMESVKLQFCLGVTNRVNRVRVTLTHLEVSREFRQSFLPSIYLTGFMFGIYFNDNLIDH